MVLKPLKIIKVPVVETYDLVDWPDDCMNTPTYFQLLSTLDIVELYKTKPDSFSEELAKVMEQWLTTNSIQKFEQARNLAEEVQDRLDYIKQEFVDTNREFPMKWRRQDN